MLALLASRAASSGGTLAYTVAATMDGNATMSGAGPYVATITGVGFGAEAADRTIVLCYAIKGTGSIAPTAITIGGVAATIDLTMADRHGHVIAHAPVPSGTSGDVTVTMSASVAPYSLIAYRVTGGTVSVHATASHSADTTPVILDINSVAGGFVAALAYSRFGGNTAWTGAIEDYEPFSSFASAPTSGSPVSISAALITSPSNVQGLAVAYRAN